MEQKETKQSKSNITPLRPSQKAKSNRKPVPRITVKTGPRPGGDAA